MTEKTSFIPQDHKSEKSLPTSQSAAHDRELTSSDSPMPVNSERRQSEAHDRELNWAKLFFLGLLRQQPGLLPDELSSRAAATLFFNSFIPEEALGELLQQGLIVLSENKEEKKLDAFGKKLKRCYLLPKGAEVWEQLKTQLPEGLLQELKAAVRKTQAQAETHASFSPDANGAYTVNMIASEAGGELLQIRLSVPDEKRARDFCRRWPEVSARLYGEILAELSSRD